MKQYISIAIIVAIVAGALGYGIGFKIGRQKADADLSAATEKAKKYFSYFSTLRIFKKAKVISSPATRKGRRYC